MLTSLCKAIAFITLAVFCCFTSSGQLPTSNLLYMRSPTSPVIYNYDPLQPVSATNPGINTIQLPNPPGHGLAICEVLNSGNSVPTFYTIIDDRYFYYDPFTDSWVNTNHKTGSGGVAVNFGGGGGFIYNFDAIGGKVYKYDGTGDGVLLTDVPGYGNWVGMAGVADVVVDCKGDWYIMLLFPGNNPDSYLRKYDPSGTLLQTWAINNPNNFSSGPGFGIVDDTIYLINQIANPAGLSVPSASLNTTTINFNTVPALMPISTLNDDMGSASGGGGILTPTINITASENPVCPGSVVVFSSAVTNGGVSPGYQWFVNGVAVVGATNATFSFTPDNHDTVNCQLVTAAASCSLKAVALSNAIIIQVLDSQTPALGYNPSVFCKNAEAAIPIFSPAGGTFKVRPAGLAIDMNTGMVDPEASEPGTYIVTYIIPPAAGCKQDSVQDTITITPLPVAQINTFGNPYDLCLNDTFSLFAVPETGYRYTWKPADYFPNGNEEDNVTAKAISDGVIYLTVFDSIGCISTDTISFKAKPCCSVFLPNAFSPDNDGLNDIFKMYSKSSMQQDINFSVYNRWGEKVFSTSNQLSGWDGRYHNEIADAGVYFYYLDYTCVDGTKKALKGEVLLIR